MSADPSTGSRWPQPLEPVHGPFPKAKLDGVLAGMGQEAPVTVGLIEAGTLSPDMMTQLTLYLLAGQPRPERSAARAGKGAPGVSGRIWARERVTYHAPIALDAAFVTRGESLGREVRRGRRYATTSSRTVDAGGSPVATNLTTGLLAYRADPTLADAVEGCAPEDLPVPPVDAEAARRNPHLDALADAREGEMLGGHEMVMRLEMMAARDTDDPDNPIHSDPERAREAGLAKPIAGGSHVQAFALELLIARFGPEVLLHGTHVDTRWKAPTEADATIVPRAVITEVRDDRVAADFDVQLADGRTAMAGRLVIPRPA